MGLNNTYYVAWLGPCEVSDYLEGTITHACSNDEENDDQH